MHATILVKTVDVAKRLTAMALQERFLSEAAIQGYIYRSNLTPHHPRTYVGSVMWGETVAALRNLLRPLGWEPKEKGNYELTFHPVQKLSIVVAAGDAATGLPNTTPSNRRPKGVKTAEAIEANHHRDLFAELLPKSQIESKDQETWVLLHHIDEDNEIRLELSCPSEIGEDGKIKNWNERIILSSIPLDSGQLDKEIPQTPNIDIPVRRRTTQ